MKRWLLILGMVTAVFLGRQHVAVAATTTAVIQLAETEHEQEGGNDDFFVPATSTPVVPAPVTNTDTPESGTTPVNTSASTTTTAEVPVSPTVDTSTSAIPPTSASTAAQPTPNISTNFPWAWVTARAAGIASYILLTLLSVIGMLLTMGVLYRFMSPEAAWSLHRAIGSVLLFSVLTHLGTLLLDSFMKLRVVDIFIPFVSPFKPLFMSLGIFGFYLLLLVLATSLYTLTSHAKFWRTVHFFAFPMFVLILLHGLLIGTDAKLLWVKIVYWSGAALVGLTVLFRLYWKYHLGPISATIPSSGRVQQRRLR